MMLLGGDAGGSRRAPPKLGVTMIMLRSSLRSVRRLLAGCLPVCLCLFLGGTLGWGSAVGAAETSADGPVSYHKQIRPLFQATCQGCHQPAKAQGGYVMTEVARLLHAGDSGVAGVGAGKPEESRLLTLLEKAGGESLWSGLEKTRVFIQKPSPLGFFGFIGFF